MADPRLPQGLPQGQNWYAVRAPAGFGAAAPLPKTATHTATCSDRRHLSLRRRPASCCLDPCGNRGGRITQQVCWWQTGILRGTVPPYPQRGSAALSISANAILLEAVLAVPCRPRFLRFDRSFTHSDCRGTGIGADRGSAAQRALGEGHASGACSLTTTAGCSRRFSGSAGASVAGASLPRLRRQTWP